MAKGKLNTPWNRFWLLVSVLWMVVCWYGASSVNIPPDYDRLAQQWSTRTSLSDSDVAAYDSAHGKSVEAIHNRELLIALGTIGFVLWFLARFVRHGFAFGFKSTEPSPPPPAA